MAFGIWSVGNDETLMSSESVPSSQGRNIVPEPNGSDPEPAARQRRRGRPNRQLDAFLKSLIAHRRNKSDSGQTHRAAHQQGQVDLCLAAALDGHRLKRHAP